MAEQCDDRGRLGSDDPACRPGGQDAMSMSGLPELGRPALRAAWRQMYRTAPPAISRDLLIRGLAYRMQEQCLGGLTKATQRKLRALQQDFATNGEIAIPVEISIKPGSRLVREWHGRTHIVSVTAAGFEHEGRTYASLTRIAQVITGAHWSGPRFFGLTKVDRSTQPHRRAEQNGQHARAAGVSGTERLVGADR